MADSSPSRGRTALAVGLAFVIGTLVFFIVFQAVRVFSPARGEPLIPIAKRQPGSLSAEILLPGAGTPASVPSAGAATAPVTWNLADQRGRVVIVNYFATWCGPCMMETPDLVKVAADYASKGVTTVAVSVDRDEDRNGGESSRLKALERFKQQYKVAYPILVPPANSLIWTMDFAIPQTFLYDKQGRRAMLIVGPVDEKDLRHKLDELLGEPEAG